MTSNDWCQVLGIAPPKLEAVAGHREANTFALLLVALLERGEAMTLADVAARFEQAGIADRSSALLSLKRCRPGRAPAYREGDLYHLNPHDDALDLWVFQLGLRPPKGLPTPRRVVEAAPLPGPETALTLSELDEGLEDARLYGWSAQRLVVAVLDAHGGPLLPAEVVAAVTARTTWHGLREDAPKFLRRGSAVEVLADGRWAIAAGADAVVKQARKAVRGRVAMTRRHAEHRTDPAVIAQLQEKWAEQRAARGAELAILKRALLVAFPPARPEAVALLDVGAHSIATFVGDELAALPSRLAAYDILGGLDVRVLLRALGFDPGERRLVDLQPPQKSKKLNQRGRTLKITTEMLVQGSCGIGAPFGDPKKLAAYLAAGDLTKLRRRLEADVKSLHALYEYARLHRGVRLRWGFLDEHLPVRWFHRDEPSLHDLARSARELNVPLQVVVGNAPGWAEPWSRGRLADVAADWGGWGMALYDELGELIPQDAVQRARLTDGG
jgi:hypothetical protein